MSWLEDFSDGEAFWKRLMSAPTLGEFLDRERGLSNYERDKIILFHAISEKQAAGEWADWSRQDP